MKDLQHYIEKERDRKPLISSTQIDSFLETHGNRTPHIPTKLSTAHWYSTGLSIIKPHTTMIATTAGILAVLIGFFSWNSNSSTNTHYRATGPIHSSDELLKQHTDSGVLPIPRLYNKSNGNESTTPKTDLSTHRLELKKGLDTYKKEKKPDEDAPKETGKHKKPEPSILGVRMIELNTKELAQIGLQPDANGIWFFYEQGENTNGFEVVIVEMQAVDLNQARQPWDGFRLTTSGIVHFSDLENQRKKEVAIPPFHPIFITDDLGNRRVRMRRDNDPDKKALERRLQELDENAKQGALSRSDRSTLYRTIMQEAASVELQQISSGKLVPVLVRTGQTFTEQDKANRRWRPDCIFWYEPTDEFLAALPEHIRRPLQRELYVSSLLQDKPQEERIDDFMQRQPLSSREAYDSLLANQSDNDGVSVVAGDSYLDSWRAVSGAITSSSVLPNPAHDKLYINYRLATPRQVTLGLYDVNGQLVQILSDVQESSGENLRVFDLKDITPGMYLLSIATDAGERAVQRVIVE